MPRKDRESKNEYQREWYHRPGNAQVTIAKVKRRQKTKYAGVCQNCGGPTVGLTKGKAPTWCGKPACRSKQFQLRSEEFKEYQRRAAVNKEETLAKRRWTLERVIAEEVAKRDRLQEAGS